MNKKNKMNLMKKMTKHMTSKRKSRKKLRATIFLLYTQKKKNVETDDGREVVIQIKSPGPVEVENLQTKNIGGAPSFGGICGLDPVCMEDVTMEVDHQNVEKISLPDASIETCFADECDDMHEV